MGMMERELQAVPLSRPCRAERGACCPATALFLLCQWQLHQEWGKYALLRQLWSLPPKLCAFH